MAVKRRGNPPLSSIVNGVGWGNGGSQTQIGGTPIGPATNAVAFVPYGSVQFTCQNPQVQFNAYLNTDGAQPTGGGSRHEVRNRVKRTSVAEYVGHDPLRMSVAIVLDGYRAGVSIEPMLGMIDALASRVPGGTVMPEISLAGGVPYHDRTWFIDGPPTWDTTPTPIRDYVSGLMRQALTLSLVEKVSDQVLTASVTKSVRSGGGAKNGPFFTHVQKGEDDFGDVSARLYQGNRNRATDLATANGLPLGSKLTVGKKLRYAKYTT